MDDYQNVTPLPSITDSILNSTKKMLLIAVDYTAFDPEIIMHINTYLQRLRQLGVGNKSFVLTDATQTWQDFLDDPTMFAQAKTYVYMRVRLVFDPPQNSAVIKSFEANIKELEVLLNVDAEHEEVSE